jgi:hypothetical protein
MEGIQYIVTENGDKTAVLIDLKVYSNIWEDFYDILLANSRKNEPRTSLQSVKNQLIKDSYIHH